eukprot:g2865.t1
MECDNFLVSYATWRYENGLEREPEILPICGTKFTLQELWNAVQSLGGSRRVSEGRLWATVGRKFHPPPTMTNFSFRIKNIFAEQLLEYERSINPDKAMLKPNEIAKKRSARTTVESRNLIENGDQSTGVRRSSKRLRSRPIRFDQFHRINDSAKLRRSLIDNQGPSPIDEYRESLADLENASRHCANLLTLLQEAVKNAKIKARACHQAYEKLCGKINIPEDCDGDYSKIKRESY